MKTILDRLREQIQLSINTLRAQVKNNPLGLLAMGTLILIVAAWGFGIVIRGKGVGFANKTLWDLMELLLIPAALAVVGLWFSRIQKKTELRIAEKAREKDREIARKARRQDREIAENERETDRKIAQDRREQETLENYLDRIKEFLLDRNLGPDAEPHVRRLARTLTLNALRELTAIRNRQVIQFLQESELLTASEEAPATIDLSSADLVGADLSGVNMAGINLRNANLERAHMAGINLRRANLANACLCDADLSGADLFKVGFSHTLLRRADLSDTSLEEAVLAHADLSGANLTRAYFDQANLSNAILSLANMTDAIFHDIDLENADLRRTDLTKVEALSVSVRLNKDKLLHVHTDEKTSWPHNFNRELLPPTEEGE